MGSLFSSKKERKLLFVGLDNSGKTTLVNQLKPDKKLNNETVPTVGCNMETFKKNNVKHFAWFVMWTS